MSTTEFWESEATNASWEKLNELSKDVSFVLIGGWAVYLYTKLQKSKGIDIIVDFRTLRVLESKYRVDKNERLRKYEIRAGIFDIDIYLPKYSRLTIPAEGIMGKYFVENEGFLVPTPEAMVLLKLGAAVDRGESLKGRKDAIDIIGLLFYSEADVSKIGKLAKEYKLEGYPDLLMNMLSGFDRRDLRYLNLNENSFSKLKAKYMRELKSIR